MLSWVKVQSVLHWIFTVLLYVGDTSDTVRQLALFVTDVPTVALAEGGAALLMAHQCGTRETSRPSMLVVSVKGDSLLSGVVTKLRQTDPVLICTTSVSVAIVSLFLPGLAHHSSLFATYICSCLNQILHSRTKKQHFFKDVVPSVATPHCSATDT